MFRFLALTTAATTAALTLVTGAATASAAPLSSPAAATWSAGLGQAPAGPAKTQFGAELSARLGDRSAGSYIDDAGRLVVTVLDETSAQQVASTGAVAERVTRTAADLERATDALKASAPVPGIALSTDVATNQVVLSIPPDVSGAALDALLRQAREEGDAVRVEHAAAPVRPMASGGDGMHTWKFDRCSLGFNVKTSTGADAWITAGHCGLGASTWFSGSAGLNTLGTFTVEKFPGSDYAVAPYSSLYIGDRPSTVGSQLISSAADALQGQNACRRGNTTGTHCGKVTSPKVAKYYPGHGWVDDLVGTNICIEQGDSGGPLYAGTVALGIASGGGGNCTTGGTSYYQPILPVLDAHHLRIPNENMLHNGSFEEPAIARGTWTVTSTMPHWATPAGRPVEVQNHARVGGGDASRGEQFIELDANQSTSVTQTVTTVPGKRYVLSVDYSPRPGVAMADNFMRITWNGGSAFHAAADGRGNSTPKWRSSILYFTAASATSTLQISDMGPSNGLGMYVDNVVLMRVP